MTTPNDLTPPGSAVYDSQTMYVGDGTWDTKLNTFLLPNLQGLNFETMRFNGMANRFSQEPGYLTLVEAHGILAAITFLFIVPFAIVFARFYSNSSPWAIRIHIWCQILTLLITTALFALGNLAVGPSRALTNPHHGIGVAIYVLVLFQFFLGWFTYRREKKWRFQYSPIKAILHRWIGRATAMLGIAQIALGLTLYGSPEYLFILYALVVFAWVAIYFIHSVRDERYGDTIHGSEYSWASGDGGSRHRRQGRFSNVAKPAAAGAGIAYVANKLRRRSDPPPGSHHSGTQLQSEKYSEESIVQERKNGRWGKLLGAGALGGLGYYVGRILGRRKDTADADTASYTSYSGATDDHALPGESGQPLNGPASQHALPGAAPPAPLLGGMVAAPAAVAGAESHHHRHDSQASVSYDSEDDYSSASPSHKRRNHGIRDAIIGLGGLGIARKLFKDRRAKKEQARIDELRRQDIEEERMNRANSQRQRFTGDGLPRPGASDRRNSLTNTDLTPIPAGGTSLATGVSHAGMGAANPPYQHPAYGGGFNVDGQPLPVVPPPPRDSELRESGSELYTAPDGTPHHRHHATADAAAAGLAGGAAGLAAGEMLRNRREHSETRRTSGNMPAGNTPPVSVKLNMHNDGRHVTLRRLTEEEAAADRARNRQRRRRGGSASDVSDPEDEARWRRNDARPPMDETQAERQRLQASQTRLNAGAASGSFPIPPPPIPGSDPQGRVGSPGTHDGTATEASTNYERNRRRRRAERAASGQQRQRVEFD